MSYGTAVVQRFRGKDINNYLLILKKYLRADFCRQYGLKGGLCVEI
jgi:hypothetical protein